MATTKKATKKTPAKKAATTPAKAKGSPAKTSTGKYDQPGAPWWKR